MIENKHYSGWKLFDKVIIVANATISTCASDYEMPALLRSRLTEAGFNIR